MTCGYCPPDGMSEALARWRGQAITHPAIIRVLNWDWLSDHGPLSKTALGGALLHRNRDVKSCALPGLRFTL